MSAGYGRGYYGEGQLERGTPRRRNWFTAAAVLGAGAAVVWFFWPRKSPIDLGPASKEPERSTQTVAVDTVAAPTEATGAFLKQLEDDARASGFVLVKDYEDSVVKSAKQLQAAGAKVELAPHLQHLAARTGA